MSALVTFRRCDSYDRTNVETAVSRILQDMGGAAKFFRPGSTVLLKPNFLKDDPRNKGIITHPEIIRAVAKVAIGFGCKVKVGDSPGFGSIKWILKRSGFENFFDDLPLEIVPFKNPVELRNESGMFKRFHVDREILNADIIINLPKLKTHGQMLVSMAVKNMFGSVVGAAKPQWHLRAGISHSYFAKMLLELHYSINPALSIIDGIIAMEGEGPSAGNPVSLNFIAASTDAILLDKAVCEILNIDQSKVLTIEMAKELSLKREEAGILVGDDPEQFRCDDFVLPDIVSLETLAVAPWLGRYLKDALTVRPDIQREKCVLCEACIKQCPAGIMSLKYGKKDKYVSIDYRNCIRCFCCQEICPEEAIKLKKGWLLRLFGRKAHS